MKISIKPCNHKLFFTLNKPLGAVFLLLATSTLFACSEPNSTAATAAPVEAATDTSIRQVQAADTTDPINSTSGSLKNVSASIYKDANCGCCSEWIEHAEGHGLSADAHDVTDLMVFKERYGVPNNMQSCHTTVTTDGYVFEGHVPAKHMAQFLANPPSEAIGLAVPGMPMGSPGMEYQGRFDPYQVMQINKDGSTSVYANIDSPEAQL